MMRTPFNFHEAAEEFGRFLNENGFLREPLWVFHDDVAGRQNYIYLRWPLPQSNATAAERLFEHGRQKRLGVKLEAFGQVDDRPCCFIFVPEDKTDSEHALMADLKFSTFVQPLPVRKHRSGWLWRVLARNDPKSPFRHFIGELPRRKPL